MEDDGQKWIPMDILSHLMDTTRQQLNSMERSEKRSTEMDSERQRWIEMDSD